MQTNPIDNIKQYLLNGIQLWLTKNTLLSGMLDGAEKVTVVVTTTDKKGVEKTISYGWAFSRKAAKAMQKGDA